MAYLTTHMATTNFLTKRGTAVFRGANSALWPCSCAIRALWRGPQHLGIIGHMWRELLAQWPTLQYPPLPATPCRCVQPRLHTTQAHIPGWLSRGSRHIVDVRLCPRLLGITSHMSRELPTPWATLQFTFMPPTPRRKLENKWAELHLGCGGHAVPALSKSPGGTPNV